MAILGIMMTMWRIILMTMNVKLKMHMTPSPLLLLRPVHLYDKTAYVGLLTNVEGFPMMTIMTTIRMKTKRMQQASSGEDCRYEKLGVCRLQQVMMMMIKTMNAKPF